MFLKNLLSIFSFGVVKMIKLKDFETFIEEPVIKDLIKDHDKKIPIYREALFILYEQLKELNRKKAYFSLIRGRVKGKISFAKKLFKAINDEMDEKDQKIEITQEYLYRKYYEITDIAGIRVAVRYYDEIFPIANIVRTALLSIGYIDISSNGIGYSDSDKKRIEHRNDKGNRGFHFLIGIPQSKI